MRHPHRHGVSSSNATGFELTTLWPRVCDHNHLSITATRTSRNSFEIEMDLSTCKARHGANLEYTQDEDSKDKPKTPIYPKEMPLLGLRRDLSPADGWERAHYCLPFTAKELLFTGRLIRQTCGLANQRCL
ncbi:hypothetical protein TNCV_4635571 [Trichonephila clavipes]|nr:hypothetical protein TNCV_4635571 [Trichonephila clavipes]